MLPLEHIADARLDGTGGGIFLARKPRAARGGMRDRRLRGVRVRRVREQGVRRRAGGDVERAFDGFDGARGGRVVVRVVGERTIDGEGAATGRARIFSQLFIRGARERVGEVDTTTQETRRGSRGAAFAGSRVRRRR